MSESKTPTKLTIKRRRGKAQYFIERLSESISLDIVMIPKGTFVMGAPESEEGSQDSERPQHEVSIETFFLGKYPITQVQYEAVMGNNLSKFKNEPDSPNHPVENVSWDDAVEFCRCLSKQTGKEYRLPSEAEWEYACRAMTSPPVPFREGEEKIVYPPFHFGETISTDIANYRGTDEKNGFWSGSYGKGAKGIDRKKTTPVGYFKVANDFGLYDMHGNVCEWCADIWHRNYEGAPKDGRAWIEGGDTEKHAFRSGAWVHRPKDCRSAVRNYDINNIIHDYTYGFRVACSSRGLL